MKGSDLGRFALAAAGRGVSLGLQLKIGAIVAALAVLAIMVVGGVMMGAVTDSGPDRSDCPRPGQPNDPGPNPGGSLRQQQIANAKTIQSTVQEAGMPGYATFIAVLTAIGESDLINIDHGDEAGPDSRGLFQQRNGWGTEDERMDPKHATLSFLLGPDHDGKGGLAAVDGWTEMQPSQAAHLVQRNADPDHYSRYIGRLDAIAAEADLDFEAPGDPHPRAGSNKSPDSGMPDAPDPCEPAGDYSQGGNFTVGTGDCPVDDAKPDLAWAGKRDCNEALEYLAEAMNTGSRDWYRKCLLLVETAYGHPPNGVPTAQDQGHIMQRRGLLSTDTRKMPRGAVLYWEGGSAGHVAIYDGEGYILSNDAPINDGRVGRVPWNYPAAVWGQTFLGWGPPYFPSN